MSKKYDFGGYVTKADIRCSDGRTIKRGAFKDQDGEEVPLVWAHMRDDPSNVLGKVLLEHRDDGVYGYATFNNSKKAQQARELVNHGDIKAMSIHANQLVQRGGDVLHGMIREVSLVLAGANKGALIDNLALQHDDGGLEEIEDEAIIYNGFNLEHSDGFEVYHADDDEEEDDDVAGQKTMREIFDTLNDEQKDVVYAMLSEALAGDDDEDDDEVAHSDDYDEDEDYEEDEDEDYEEDEEDDDDEEEDDLTVKRNVFDQSEPEFDNSLSHEDVQSIFENARRFGSLREAVRDFGLEHSIVGTGEKNSTFPDDVLFPEARQVGATPEMIMRNQEWVSKVWNATRKSPFSRVKTMAADIRGEDARALGYVKGKKKKEEVIAMLKRVTTPQTVYKLQKLDRDDIIDITSFDVVAWIKAEMRMMLNEELARAILIGDGRAAGDDKINETNIRPVWTDDDLYTIHAKITKASADAATDNLAYSDLLIDTVATAMEDYMGSGSPVAYMAPGVLTKMKLARDKIGRRLYNTNAEVAAALGVRDIVEVPVFKNQTRKARQGVTEENGKKYTLQMLLVNLSDYNVGADRGGAVSLFDDFDIDYNKYTYLIETRCSGALIKPYSAIAVEIEDEDQD